MTFLRCNNEELKQFIPTDLIKFMNDKLNLVDETTLADMQQEETNMLLCNEPFENLQMDPPPSNDYYD